MGRGILNGNPHKLSDRRNCRFGVAVTKRSFCPPTTRARISSAATCDARRARPAPEFLLRVGGTQSSAPRNPIPIPWFLSRGQVGLYRDRRRSIRLCGAHFSGETLRYRAYGYQAGREEPTL